MSAHSSAAPIISGPFAFTENFGPNTAGFTPGHILHVGAVVSDTAGVPSNIASVTATSLVTGTVTAIPFQNIGSIFNGLYDSLTPYSGETGAWRIDVTDNSGNVTSATTPGLDSPKLIPLATNLTVSGSLAAPLITWDPVLFDGVNEVNDYRIRLLNSSTNQFFRSGNIVGNSFQLPIGLLTDPGLTYIRLEARERDSQGNLENRSSTFAQFVATVPEPATVLLLIGGFLGINLTRRFKKAV